MSTVISKTLSDGRTATVGVIVGQTGRPTVDVRIDGKWQPGDFAALPEPVVRGDVTITHQAACLGLTAAEAATVQKEIDRLDATPECRNVALHQHRRSLVEAWQDAEAAERDRRADAHDRGDMREAVRMDETSISAARDALHAFDAQHPEIAAEVKAARDEATRRNMWS